MVKLSRPGSFLLRSAALSGFLSKEIFQAS